MPSNVVFPRNGLQNRVPKWCYPKGLSSNDTPNRHIVQRCASKWGTPVGLPKSAPSLSGQNSMSGQGRCPSGLVLSSEGLGGRENPEQGHESQEEEGIGWGPDS